MNQTVFYQSQRCFIVYSRTVRHDDTTMLFAEIDSTR